MQTGRCWLPWAIALLLGGCAATTTPVPTATPPADAGRIAELEQELARTRLAAAQQHERLKAVPDVLLHAHGVYRVKGGDAPGGIARRFGVTWPDIAAWNGLTDTSLIAEGMLLFVRPPTPPDFSGSKSARLAATRLVADAIIDGFFRTPEASAPFSTFFLEAPADLTADLQGYKAGHRPRVTLGRQDAEVIGGAVKDRTTGGRGIVVTVIFEQIMPERIVVGGATHYGTLGGSYRRYVVELVDGAWRIVSSELISVS